MRHPSFRHLNRNHGGNELEVHAGETVGEHNCLVADLFFLGSVYRMGVRWSLQEFKCWLLTRR